MNEQIPRDRLSTHRVTNQPGPLPELNLWHTDAALRAAVEREGGAWATGHLSHFGNLMGRRETLELAEDANRNPPALHSYDRYGRRLDQVRYHPAYHRLMAIAIEHGIHSIAWTADAGGHVVHTALEYLFAQIEGGVCCPVTMTYAAVPVLRHSPQLAETWLPKVLSREYDERFIPAAGKTGLTLGMAMTEKQGGSDLRTNTTEARPLDGDWYRLRGHKWFCSAPMSDGFLTLARSAEGLSCFLVPRWSPEGVPNPFMIQRLKDKLGNRSNASSEVEFDDTRGLLVGEPGRGIATIMTMVKHTRLDTCLAPVALMRQALVQALHHVRHREAFGGRLVDQPLMRSVLADMALELEASVVLLFRIARSFDDSGDEDSEAFSRLAAAIGKFHLNKRSPAFVAEAMEMLGGSGYVEESLLPRLYREAPLNGIWEGSGNVICLDVLRTGGQYPAALEALFAELEQARGEHRELDAALDELKELAHSAAGGGDAAQAAARRLTETAALVWQGALLTRFAEPEVAGAFCRSRLAERRSGVYGAGGAPLESLVDRLESAVFFA